MDHAVISTTVAKGTFPSLGAYTIERDVRMPIRCTLQYYHVTDDASISDEDMKTIASEVTRHKPIGSLVVGGRTERPTEHSVPVPPPVPSTADGPFRSFAKLCGFL